MAGNITDVTDNNFQAEVLGERHAGARRLLGPVVRPCRMIAPLLQEIAERARRRARSSSSTSTTTSRPPRSTRSSRSRR